MNSDRDAYLPELAYIHDPLCGWCYGMSPVINQVEAAFVGRVEVSVQCGGLSVGARAMPIAETWGHLKSVLGDVEKATGVQFGPAFRALAEEGRYVYDSEPPSRAIVAFRQAGTYNCPNRTLSFAQAVQAALFRDGQDLNDPVTYYALSARLGVRVVNFKRHFQSPDTARITQLEFAAAARSGVQGFPTVVLRLGGKDHVLARGYQPFESLQAQLAQLLDKA